MLGGHLEAGRTIDPSLCGWHKRALADRSWRNQSRSIPQTGSVSAKKRRCHSASALFKPDDLATHGRRDANPDAPAIRAATGAKCP